jgi:diguanylate cyclase (GGDEF)-like protein
MMKKRLPIDNGRVDIEQVELKGFASSIAEIEWLLLLLVILYYVAPDAQVLHPAGLVASMVGFAVFVLGFHYINANAQQKRWKLALETWVMILFITWVIWNTGGVQSPLINLYLLVIIISAITLGKIITLLEILLIAAVYFLVAFYGDASFTYAEFSRVMIYFSPFVLVAYVTTLLVADLYNGRRLFQALAETDELTGLLNQRSFIPLYDKTCSEASDHRQPLSLLVLDVDNIHELNEQHGHKSGDRLLQTVAGVLTDHARSSDLVCRHGGGEFVLVLPQLPAARALELAERIRRAIANTSFDVAGSKVVSSISIGLASFPVPVTDVAHLFDKANECLWIARKTGGNRVMHFEADISPT